jgi:two-component system response regulator RegX3
VIFEVPVLGVSVVDACRIVRASSALPIVIVAGPHAEREAIAAFAAGVDTVITEPVGAHELIARVRALLRRRPAALPADDQRLRVGPILLDRAKRELTVRGIPVSLPRREFDIADVLMREAGRVVRRTVIVRELWGSMPDTKSLDVQVGRLRTRLAAAGAGSCILTVRGVGFRFAAAEEFSAEMLDLTIDADDTSSSLSG